MANQLLFVCAANVCRSPLMEITFNDSEALGIDHSQWEVMSRGTSVVRENPMCELAASLSGRVARESHVSQQLTESELGAQDLIIVASREERAHLARLLPSIRTRTFTLKEAVQLGAAMMEAREVERSRVIEGERAAAGYAALLNHRRGRTAAPHRPSIRAPWVQAADPHDIPDVHHGSPKNHANTLVQLRSLVRTVQRRIGEYIDSE